MTCMPYQGALGEPHSDSEVIRALTMRTPILIGLTCRCPAFGPYRCHDENALGPNDQCLKPDEGWKRDENGEYIIAAHPQAISL